MATPFKRAWVDHYFRDGSVIFWELDESFSELGPYQYTAEWGRSPTDVWTPLNQPPVFDTYFLVDYEQRLFGKSLELYFRVRLDTGEGTYYSLPVRADGGMPKTDWLKAREIVRLEYLHMIKGPSGVHGCLMKRRNWGPRCFTCTDYDTGQVSDGLCPECYGVGIVGGYYPSVDFWVLPVPPAQRTTRQGQGHTVQIDLQVRCVAYPYLGPGDIWVQTETGRRYVIGEGQHQIREATNVRNKPVVLIADMGLAPASHIAYDFPLEACVENKTYRGKEGDPCEPDGGGQEVQTPGGGLFVPDY